MKLFSTLYNKALAWSAHRHAPYYLSALSFAESSCFPIPPDVMLIPMVMAKPKRAWFYAMLTTVFSVLGGLFGYLLGYFFIQLIHPHIVSFGYEPAFITVQHWFAQWGFWVIFLAGFSPIPYKIFTISAGVVHMHLFPFVIASVISRGARFLLVAAAMYFAGDRLDDLLQRYIERLGWLMVGLFIIIYLLFHFDML